MQSRVVFAQAISTTEALPRPQGGVLRTASRKLQTEAHSQPGGAPGCTKGRGGGGHQCGWLAQQNTVCLGRWVQSGREVVAPRRVQCCNPCNPCRCWHGAQASAIKCYQQSQHQERLPHSHKTPPTGCAAVAPSDAAAAPLQSHLKPCPPTPLHPAPRTLQAATTWQVEPQSCRQARLPREWRRRNSDMSACDSLAMMSGT